MIRIRLFLVGWPHDTPTMRITNITLHLEYVHVRVVLYQDNIDVACLHGIQNETHEKLRSYMSSIFIFILHFQQHENRLLLVENWRSKTHCTT